MLLILTISVLTRTCLASDFWVSKWSNTPVGPDGPWHALNISWDDKPAQNFAMLPSLTKTSLLIAADACSTQNSQCPNQVSSGDWPMWTSSAAHKPYLWQDGELYNGGNWDETVSWPLNLTGDGQWAHERAIVWNTDDENVSLYDQAITLTHNYTVNSPAGGMYTMNAGFFSLYGGQNESSWLNATGSNVTQMIQLPFMKNVSAVSSVSYGLHVGSPSLSLDPSLVMGGYDRSRCLTDPVTTHNTTFILVDVSIGSAGSGWPFVDLYSGMGNLSENSQSGFLERSVQILANPGVPYLYLPQQTCDSIAKYLPVTYNQDLGLYIWNQDLDSSNSRYKELIETSTYLSFNIQDESTQEDKQLHVPFALLTLELDYPITNNKTRYFPCRPYTPRDGQPYHLGRAFLQAALLAQNWETNTTWLSQAPGPNATASSRPVIIQQGDTTIAVMPNAPAWLSTWDGTLRQSNWNQVLGNGTTGSTLAESDTISGGTIAGIVIGALAGIAIIAAAILFYVRRRRAKAGYGDVALISFADSEDSPHRTPELEHKPTHEAGSTPVYEVESPEKMMGMSELPSSSHKNKPSEVEGIGIAELPGHDVQPR
ncbi:hypothetical protein AUEXF2481DRAFT_4990 [Aureobasidium subglaciale EXF-2481]|uniref:Peptidase A1 domain-containing protein n=1 Tax=Aureobasidium subglaciale (strain EXF-2481) TaxID=1043005 RepID=A0A074YCA6_AURSE|nr:uncharacterized protein AUEXF2481DRAFT_4990 [Aureobasidium subglaciale EXF-2481]KAI5204907.1 hypothetical protein E4T38_04507 [Aureobasidium subglaciale]KAI5223854.1 hypothetical protein E4T40_04283 [Aureobasidium subglaciale]KAI5227374.1 hypothetical protein E4T41_04365 [Aureobasidium subglaciale]KAI5262749.1 hypothetical protein E4T46_04251 [Aureobasidium subglaciale]KEQ95380.1 hypothetical protein AUEXF2481DRAFT_4990 [Aureobasidium subglaciale EXF-2481]